MNFKLTRWKMFSSLIVAIVLAFYFYTNLGPCFDCTNSLDLQYKLKAISIGFIIGLLSTYVIWSLTQKK
jgi:hypothetical protein